MIQGGWDIIDRLTNPDCTEEIIKQSVYVAINKYAQGGGYVFHGSFLGRTNDEKTIIKNRWIAEAVATYGSEFYK